MKVLILTSGGDAPGMNMVIGSLFKKFKGKLYACRAGFKGLVNNDIISMKEYKPLKFINASGSVIKCSRCDAFKKEEHFKKAIDNAKRFDVVVVLGGNGSLNGAQELSKAGVHTIYIPATIDNDVEGSEYSLGFHTAVKGACETYRNIMPSFDAHERCGVFEVMGRKCDKLAKAVGEICRPDFLVVSEEDINYNQIANTLLHNKEIGEASSIIIKENLLDLSTFVENISKTVPEVEVRAVQVGYIQRGNRPTTRELKIAKQFAKKASQEVYKDKSVKLFLQNGKIVAVDM